MNILLTGGAGFIGSSILRTLNDMGVKDIVVSDNIAASEKWRNLANKQFSEYIHKDLLLERLAGLPDFTHVIHMGACSDTTEKNFDYLYANNVEYTKLLWNYCAERQISFIYASSAATYGSGEQGFSDEDSIGGLVPLNAYGYSKNLFDVWAAGQDKTPKQHVGFKFFNVYGPNEYHKGAMASVVYHGFKQIKESGKIRLFKSHHPDYQDGGQLRDFVYVKDVCSVIKFFLENPAISGLYNLGTGRAESFATLGESIFKALDMPVDIVYFDMPEHLRDKYQYFTEAKMNKLRAAGYKGAFHALESGVADYVQNFLDKDFGIW